MLCHGAHQLVSLVAAPAGEPLLGPPTRGGAGLHVAGPALVLDELVAVGQAHGIPAPAHEDQSQRVVRERLAHGARAIATGGTDDGALLDEVGAVVTLGEAVQPAGDPLRADLETPGHRLRLRG